MGNYSSLWITDHVDPLTNPDSNDEQEIYAKYRIPAFWLGLFNESDFYLATQIEDAGTADEYENRQWILTTRKAQALNNIEKIRLLIQQHFGEEGILLLNDFIARLQQRSGHYVHLLSADLASMTCDAGGDEWKNELIYSMETLQGKRGRLFSTTVGVLLGYGKIERWKNNKKDWFYELDTEADHPCIEQ